MDKVYLTYTAVPPEANGYGDAYLTGIFKDKDAALKWVAHCRVMRPQDYRNVSDEQYIRLGQIR